MHIQNASSLLVVAMATATMNPAHAIEVAGVGWEGQGADAVVLQLDADPRPDLILMAYDNPARENSFRYRVGFNLDANGNAASWANGYVQVAGVGWEGQGAGAATADLDGNGRPELIFMAYDNPDRENNFRYRIGWNLDAQGQTSNWSGHAQVAGVGWEGQGAAVVIGQIDANPRPDMIFVAYDNPNRDNTFRYRIGLNVDAQGNATWAQSYVEVAGVGWEGAGTGAALANLDGNPRPDLILMAYDNPDRDNSFRYRIGLNLDGNGVAASWQPGYDSIAGLGWEGQGAGLVLTCLDADPRTDWIAMAYDNPHQANNFRYSVLLNRSQAPCPAPGGGTTGSFALRKSITQLTAQELASLRRGFTQMIAWNSAPRDTPEFRRSLLYWANMHAYFGADCGNPNGINVSGMQGVQTWTQSNGGEQATWCQCEHGSVQFLTWHRMYLYYFERVLQTAAGDPNLRLPFWDYNTDGQLPVAYRDANWLNGSGQTVANPLRVPNRLTQLNAGTSSLAASLVSTSGAMGQSSYGPFNSALEFSVHGNVHCAVAVANCPTGLMGAVPAAGLDPIFYSHHANIDRYYECWLKVNEPARLPTDTTQLNRQYSFVDGDGSVVTRRVGDMLTTAQLAYGYASGGGCPAQAGAPQPLSIKVERLFRSFQIQGATQLKRGQTVVPMRIASEIKAMMSEQATEGALIRFQLVLDGVAFDEFPGVFYEVYLRGNDGKRELLGVINFFNWTSPHREHSGISAQGAPGADRFVLDATEALRALGSSVGDAAIEIEPTTGLRDSTVELAAKQIPERANVRIREIRMEASR